MPPSYSHAWLAGDIKSPSTPTAIVHVMHILLLVFAQPLAIVT